MSPRSRPRGFTLVELLVVVIIVGVLATIGISSFRSRIFGSKATEAFAMVQSIRAAEERYRAENLTYLDVSDDNWYPAAPTRRTLRAFYATASDCKGSTTTVDCRWKLLNPTLIGPVGFGYRVNAGAAGQQMTAPAQTLPSWTGWPTPAGPWFVVQAVADMDGDGTRAYFLSSSLKSEVYSVNEGE